MIETLKDWYREGDPTKKVPKLLVGVFGGIAGAASVLGNTPLDVVKTRMQSLDAARYKNTFDCAKYVEFVHSNILLEIFSTLSFFSD